MWAREVHAPDFLSLLLLIVMFNFLSLSLSGPAPVDPSLLHLFKICVLLCASLHCYIHYLMYATVVVVTQIGAYFLAT